MAAPPPLKKNYQCSPAVQPFYTGGPVRLAPDASFVACACSDQVKVVDLASGSVRATLEGDSEPITALALTPDGSSLFAASRSRQIKLWNLDSAACTRAWKAHEGPVADMAVDASGGLLASAGTDRALLVWDVDHGFCTHAFRGHKGVVTTVTFHPDQQSLLLFSGGDDATVRIWDLVAKRCVAVLDKHFSAITSMAVSMSSNKLLSAGRDKVVNVWDLQNYSLQITVPVYEALESVCFIPEDCQLIRICDDTKRLNKQKGTVHASDCFLTVGEQGIIRIWLSQGAVCLYEQTPLNAAANPDKEEVKGGYVGAVVMPSADGIMCITMDQRLLFFNTMETDAGKFDLQINKRLIGCNEEVIDVRFVAGDDNLLAVATNLEQIRVYDLMTRTCKKELFGHKDIVLCLDTCISSFQTILLASGGKDHVVRIWDVKMGFCLAIAEGHMAAIGAIAFSKKRKNFLVSGSSDCTIKVWSLDGIQGDLLKDYKLPSQSTVAAHDKDINSLAVAPNDSLVCSGSQDRTARVWRLPELVLVVTLRGHKRGIWCVQFSPVDQCVLTASGDKTIRIWSLSDGSCLKTFEGHTSSVLRVSFLSRGAQFISAGADGLLKLWTVKTSDCVNTFDHHEDKIWALDVNSKSEMLASGGSDSIVNIWSDCTKTDEEVAIKRQEEETLKVQYLANALADTNYTKAIQLAFELRRPFKLLDVFTELLRKEATALQIPLVLKGLDKEHLRLLLEYIREWNSKPKFCHVAQHVTSVLFKVFSPQDFLEIPGLKELIEGILPYTHRHLSRIDRLIRSTFLLDYTLSCLSVLKPLGIEQSIPSETHFHQQANGNIDSVSVGKAVCLNKKERVEQHIRQASSGAKEAALMEAGKSSAETSVEQNSQGLLAVSDNLVKKGLKRFVSVTIHAENDKQTQLEAPQRAASLYIPDTGKNTKNKRSSYWNADAGKNSADTSVDQNIQALPAASDNSSEKAMKRPVSVMKHAENDKETQSEALQRVASLNILAAARKTKKKRRSYWNADASSGETAAAFR